MMAGIPASLAFQKKLLQIHNNLPREDIQRMCFLCRNLIPSRNLESITKGLQLFDQFKKQALISEDDVSFLVELLELINRNDLAGEAMQYWPTTSRFDGRQPKISSYRRLLFDMAIKSTTDDVEGMKHMASGYISINLDDIKDTFQLLVELEKHAVISQDNVSKLCDIVSNQQLIKQIENYDLATRDHRSNVNPTDESAVSHAPGMDSSMRNADGDHRVHPTAVTAQSNTPDMRNDAEYSGVIHDLHAATEPSDVISPPLTRSAPPLLPTPTNERTEQSSINQDNPDPCNCPTLPNAAILNPTSDSLTQNSMLQVNSTEEPSATNELPDAKQDVEANCSAKLEVSLCEVEGKRVSESSQQNQNRNSSLSDREVADEDIPDVSPALTSEHNAQPEVPSGEVEERQKSSHSQPNKNPNNSTSLPSSEDKSEERSTAAVVDATLGACGSVENGLEAEPQKKKSGILKRATHKVKKRLNISSSEDPEVIKMLYLTKEKKIIKRSPIDLPEGRLEQKNPTSTNQKATWARKQTKTTTKLSQWIWDNKTTIKGDTTFKTGIPVIAEGEISVGLENTFSIGHKKETRNAKTDTWELTVEGTVKSMSVLIAIIRAEQWEFTVPFEATLRKGDKPPWTERGIYRGVQCVSASVEYESKAIESGTENSTSESS